MYSVPPTQSTPRAFLASSLYLPVIRAKLVRAFHAAYPEGELRKSAQLRNLESVLLANAPIAESTPIGLLTSHIEKCGAALTHNQSVFVSRLLAYTPSTEDTKPARVAIRDAVLASVSTAYSAGDIDRCIDGMQVLLACPVDGLSEKTDAMGILCSLLRHQPVTTALHSDRMIPFAVKLFQSVSDIDLSSLQRAPTNSNILLALSSLVLAPVSDATVETEPLSLLRVRGEALNAISVALALASDPIALLNLREDSATDLTIAQRAFMVLFHEFFYEVQIRHFQIPDSYPIFLPLRLRRVRDATVIVTRMAALLVDHHASPAPLDEYSALVPSLFGLVKALIGGSAKPETAEFDSLVAEMQRGSLLYIKELCLPELVGTCFEIEHSIWTPN